MKGLGGRRRVAAVTEAARRPAATRSMALSTIAARGVALVVLLGGCTVAADPNPSPAFSPYTDPNPSPAFSPVQPYVDPNPSPAFSPYTDPNPSPAFSSYTDPNPSPAFSPYTDPNPSPAFSPAPSSAVDCPAKVTPSALAALDIETPDRLLRLEDARVRGWGACPSTSTSTRPCWRRRRGSSRSRIPIPAASTSSTASRGLTSRRVSRSTRRAHRCIFPSYGSHRSLMG